MTNENQTENQTEGHGRTLTADEALYFRTFMGGRFRPAATAHPSVIEFIRSVREGEPFFKAACHCDRRRHIENAFVTMMNRGHVVPTDDRYGLSVTCQPG